MHKKYTYKNGKRYGPYLYENTRVGEKIVTTYVGKQGDDRWIEACVLAVVVAMIAASFFLHSISPTGQATLDIASTYNYGEQLDGTLKLSLKDGEFLPADTIVRVRNGESVIEMPLSSLISEHAGNGTFYAENSSIFGEGIGYGFVGTRAFSPTINFELLISYSQSGSGSDDGSSGGDDQGQNETQSENGEQNQTESQSPESENPAEETPAEQPSTEEPAPEEVEPAAQENPVQSSAEDGGESPAEESSEVPETAEETQESEQAPITGAVVNEGDSVISGSAAKGQDYTYTLEDGQTASIVEGSVFAGEEQLDESVLDLNIEGISLTVTADYEVIEEGFGEEFLGEDADNLYEIDLSAFGINVTNSTIEIELEYGGIEIVSASKDVSIDPLGEQPEQNQTETDPAPAQNQTLNETIANETVANQTILNETIVNETIANHTEENLTSSISQTLAIPMIRIAPNFSHSINLDDYFDGAESYNISIRDIIAQVNGSILNLTAPEGFRGARQGKVVATNGSEFLESNSFNVLVSGGAISISTSRERIVAGEPVRWLKNISLAEPQNLTIELPADAQNITVTKIEEINEMGSIISANVVAELDTTKESTFIRFLKDIFSRITGRAVDEGINASQNESIEIVLSDNATEYVIEYYTSAPQINESIIDGGKRVTISASDELDYSDVIAFTNVDFGLTEQNISTLKVLWHNYDFNDGEQIDIKPVAEVENVSVVEVIAGDNASEILLAQQNAPADIQEETAQNGSVEGVDYIKQEVPFDYYDLDGNGNYEYIEWVVPHLSNQSFDLILKGGANASFTNITQSNNYSHLSFLNTAPMDRLIAYMSFDTNNGTAWTDVAGGTAYTIIDGDDETVYSSYGRAMFRNETGASGLYVPSVTSIPNFQNFTFALWMLDFDTADDGNGGLIRGFGGNGFFEGWRIAKGGGADSNYYFLAVNTSDQGEGGCQLTSCAGTVSNRWYHFAVAYDNATGNLSLYRDGNFVYNGSIRPYIDYPSPGTTDIVLGSCNGCGDFGGLIDEFMLFNGSLTSQQIRNIYNNQSSKFATQGFIDVAPMNITKGDTVFNVTLDDFMLSAYSNISTRIGQWDISRGYNETDPSLALYLHGDHNELDSSGQANHGTLTCGGGSCSSSVRVPYGKYNGSLLFDALDDEIDIAHTNSLNTTKPLTIALWAYPRCVGCYYHSLIGKDGSYMIRIANASDGAIPNNGDLEFFWGDGVNIEPGGYLRTENNIMLQNNTWYHIAATHNGTHTSLYVDGALRAFQTQSNNQVQNTNGLDIGHINSVWNFDGLLDEVMILNRSMDINEIKALHSKGRANWAHSEYQNISINDKTFDYTNSSGIELCWLEGTTEPCGFSGGTFFGGSNFSKVGSSPVRNNIMTFDGSNDYFNSSAPSFNISGGSFSVSLWAKRTRANTFEPLFFQGTASANSMLFLGFRATNVFTCAFHTNDLDTASMGFDYDWHLWTCTYDDASNTRTIYRDGVQVATGVAGADSGAAGELLVGRYADGSLFSGQMDEVALWNRPLSQPEVMSIFVNSKDRHSTNEFPISSATTNIHTSFQLSSGPFQSTTPLFTATSFTPARISASAPDPNFFPSLHFSTRTTPNETVGAQAGNSIYANISVNASTTHYVVNDLDNSLSLLMTFDEINSTGHPTDLSARSNNGTAFNGAVQSEGGKFGKAFALDGSDDYINLTPRGLGSNFTLSAWVNPSSLNQASFAATTLAADAYGGTIWDANEDDSTTGFILGIRNSRQIWWWPQSAQDVFSTGLVELNRWTHIAITYNGTTIQMYINGSLDKTQNTAGTNSPVFMKIGAKSWVTGAWQGALDEIAILGRTLSSAEILSLYNATANRYDLNLTGQTSGEHSMQGYAVDRYGQLNKTEKIYISLNFLGINSCRNITLPGTYLLQRDLNNTDFILQAPTDKCLIFDASNIRLNCQGFAINGTGITSTTAANIFATSTANDGSLSHCRLTGGSSASAASFEGTSNTGYNFTNVTFLTRYVESVTSSRFVNSTFLAASGVGWSIPSGNKFYGNRFNNVEIDACTGCDIENNTFSADPGATSGIMEIDISSSNFTRNTIANGSCTTVCLNVGLNSRVMNNNISPTSSSGDLVEIDGANVMLMNNYLQSNSAGTNFIEISNTNNATIAHNQLYNLQSNSFITFTNGDSNNIFNNTAIHNGSGSVLFVTTGSASNFIANNSINLTSTGNNIIGLTTTTSSSNTVVGNAFTGSASTFLSATGASNIVANNTFDGVATTLITMSGDGNSIYGNNLTGRGTSSVTVTGDSNVFNNNNLNFNSTGSAIVVTTAGASNAFANSTFISNTTSNFITMSTTGAANTFDNLNFTSTNPNQKISNIVSITSGSSSNSFRNLIVEESAYNAALFVSSATADRNNFTNFSFVNLNASGRDLLFTAAGVDDYYFIDSTIGNYSLGATGSRVHFLNTSNTEIRFREAINGSGDNLSHHVFLRNNLAGIDLSENIGLNRSANITFYNVVPAVRQIYRDNAPCPASICLNLSSLYISQVKFNVTTWSNYSLAGAINCTLGCVYVRNSTGHNVSIFDKFGNFYTSGSITQSSVGTPDGSDFVVTNTSGQAVYWINGLNGATRLAGTAFADQGVNCDPTGNNFLIRDSDGNCVTYINSTGHFWLKGGLLNNVPL